MNPIINYFNNLIFALIPESSFFGLKRFLWRLAGISVGNNVRISSSCKVLGSGDLSIGDNTWIGYQCLIVSSSKIVIGNNIDIAPRVYIGTGTHIIDPNAERIAATDASNDIRIEDGCWICANATILPGARIGKKCVVAAGAVVTGQFNEDKILIGGMPAKKLKSYV